ncbi:hypothetical protein L210DRAFT_930749 [Boletus edulis BED1]|uniref:Uncharacterized protein n=1 Tax=Boletus edulis BED1 TaxID=1328754 RepID=A0AAD4GDD0_BOLED|nr:hypothetical protein L210DRAFT_930749 [Boletus edulis BED1]
MPNAHRDDDWNRLADCNSLFTPLSLKRMHYTPGLLSGLWQGRMLYPDDGLYGNVMQIPQIPPNFNERSVGLTAAPVFIRLREYHCMDVHPNEPVHSGGIQNAWFHSSARFHEVTRTYHRAPHIPWPTVPCSGARFSPSLDTYDVHLRKKGWKRFKDEVRRRTSAKMQLEMVKSNDLQNIGISSLDNDTQELILVCVQLDASVPSNNEDVKGLYATGSSRSRTSMSPPPPGMSTTSTPSKADVDQFSFVAVECALKAKHPPALSNRPLPVDGKGEGGTSRSGSKTSRVDLWPYSL